MKILANKDLLSPESRKEMALFISTLLSGRRDDPFVPITTEPETDTHWQLDVAGNWRLRFFKDQPRVLEVTYRYLTGKERAFCCWLCARLDFEVFSHL